MKKTSAETTIFEFDDMTIVTVKDNDDFCVYMEVDENLVYIFSVPLNCASEIDIEALHDNGYFSTEVKP